MKVFLSYTSRDKSFVLKLANDLKTENVQVWLDEWEIRAGSSIVEEIGRGLSSNDFFILVLSPQALQSKWVHKELSASLMRHLSEKSITILPALLEKCDIPTIIKDVKYANFTSDYAKGFAELCMGLGLISSANWRHINHRQIGLADYHEVIRRLVNPEPGRGLFLNEQINLIFALRYFPEYYDLTLRQLQVLRHSWSKDGTWQPLIVEIDDTVRYINAKKETEQGDATELAAAP
jgi:hypothetical protein